MRNFSVFFKPLKALRLLKYPVFLAAGALPAVCLSQGESHCDFSLFFSPGLCAWEKAKEAGRHIGLINIQLSRDGARIYTAAKAESQTAAGLAEARFDPEAPASFPADCFDIVCAGHDWPCKKKAVFSAAGERGDIVVIKKFLSCGGNPNMTEENWRNWSLLHEAAGMSRLDIMRLLIKNGAGPEPKDSWGQTPLFRLAPHTPFSPSKRHAIDEFGRFQYESPPVERIKSAISYLTAAGADVNARDNYGETSLHNMQTRIARESEKLAIMRHLVSLGAETETKNLKGETPLDAAEFMRRKGHQGSSIVQFLDDND